MARKKRSKCWAYQAYGFSPEEVEVLERSLPPRDPLRVAEELGPGIDIAADVASVTTVAALRAPTDVTVLPDGVWARPMLNARGETGAALAAVLKAVGAATPTGTVRLATILVLEPRLAVASFDDDERGTWRRLVGAEADPLPSGVAAFVPAADHAWGATVRHLRGSGVLVEDSAMNTWAPGPGLDAIDTDGWPDGRARMVLRLLQGRDEREVLQRLPDTVQRWVDGSAA